MLLYIQFFNFCIGTFCFVMFCCFPNFIRMLSSFFEKYSNVILSTLNDCRRDRLVPFFYCTWTSLIPPDGETNTCRDWHTQILTLAETEQCLYSFNNKYLIICCHMPPYPPTRKNYSYQFFFLKKTAFFPLSYLFTFLSKFKVFIINQIIVG